MSVFTPVIEGIKGVKNANGEIQTKPFLDVCSHLLPVIGRWCIWCIHSAVSMCLDKIVQDAQLAPYSPSSIVSYELDDVY
jgi:hypothetical protein